MCSWGFKKSLSQSSHPQGLNLQRLRQRTTHSHKDNTAIRMQNTLLEYSLSAESVLKTIHSQPKSRQYYEKWRLSGIKYYYNRHRLGCLVSSEQFLQGPCLCPVPLVLWETLSPSPTYSDWPREWSCDSNFRVLLQELLPENSRETSFVSGQGAIAVRISLTEKILNIANY